MFKGFLRPFPNQKEIEMRKEKEEKFKSHPQLSSLVDGSRVGLVFCNQLSNFERRAFELRFACYRTVAQVADSLGMSWDGADELIDRVERKAERFFRNDLCQVSTRSGAS